MKSYFTVFCLLMFFLAVTFSTSFAQLPWIKDVNNPVFTGGASGSWDRLVMMPNVLYNSDSSRYEMWYAGSPGSPLRPYKIGFATSIDGISWSKYKDPVLVPTAGTWDEATVEGPMVIRENGQYKMWYTGWNPNDFVGGIGYATSTDGINWTKDVQNNPVLEAGTADWEAGGPHYCTVIPVPDGYKMWYTGINSDFSEANIGYAISTDGISWQTEPGNPVLTAGAPGEWDNPKIICPKVIVIDSVYHMWFTGLQTLSNARKIGWATSADGIEWTKYSEPVLAATYGQWDGSRVETGTVMLEGDSLRMWYSGWVSFAPISIGHATAPIIINVPGNFATIQAAIDAAKDGSVVLVDEGTYYENINFKGKAITLASQFYMDGDTSHISNTIIDGSKPSNPDSGSVVYFISGEDTTSVLYGLTITNGTGTKGQYTSEGVKYDFRGGGGIYCWNSGGRFVWNKIVNNSISISGDNDAIGGGVCAGDFGSDAWIILEGNDIMNNTVYAAVWGATGGGVGLTCNGKIINNVISYNSCTSTAFEANGGGIKITAESELLPRTVLIEGNDITHNYAEGKEVTGHNGAKGGGIVNFYCKAIISKNAILYNKVNSISGGDAYGAGVAMVIANKESILDGNTISFNTIPDSITNSGGGILIRYSNILVTNNIISNNSASNGGGISCDNFKDPQLINNTIINNVATSNGGGLYSTESNPVILNTIFWNNEAVNGAGIYPSGLTKVYYSDIQGGYTGTGNINADPFFSDSLFHLSDSSQCIGNGTESIIIGNNTYFAPEMDFEGETRPHYRDKLMDIGADESPYLQVPTGIAGDEILTPLQFALHQNYPNPFNPVTSIEYQLPKVSHVDLSIYNLLGQKVVTLVSERQKAGNHQVEWTAGQIASGVYYYLIKAGEFQDVKKMILLR